MFGKRGKKIIIFNDYAYFGGTLVLSCLCKTLRELGYDASLFMTCGMPCAGWQNEIFFKENIKSIIRYKKRFLLKKYFSFIPNVKNKYQKVSDVTSVDMDGLSFHWNPIINKEDTIVIYPEVVYGNPLRAKNVMRWFMYFYRENYKTDPGAYSKDDLFIAYRKIFNSPELNPEEYIVGQTYFNSQLYRQYNFGERKGRCYILRKGRNRKDLPEHFDGPVYDDNMTQEELVKMLNEHKYCYSYDTQTYYTTIAAVCGCIPIVVMEPGKTESDYLGKGENHLGKAYNDTPEQIEYAIRTRDELLRKLDYTERNRTNALHLIEILENRFGKVRRISKFF